MHIYIYVYVYTLDMCIPRVFTHIGQPFCFLLLGLVGRPSICQAPGDRSSWEEVLLKSLVAVLQRRSKTCRNPLCSGHGLGGLVGLAAMSGSAWSFADC